MCNYKSFILTPNLGVWWYEYDSHDEILKRLSLPDINMFNYNFLRIEVLEGDMANYVIDDEYTPFWYSSNSSAYISKVEHLLKKINPIIKNRMNKIQYWNWIEMLAITSTTITKARKYVKYHYTKLMEELKAADIEGYLPPQENES